MHLAMFASNNCARNINGNATHATEQAPLPRQNDTVENYWEIQDRIALRQ